MENIVKLLNKKEVLIEELDKIILSNQIGKFKKQKAINSLFENAINMKIKQIDLINVVDKIENEYSNSYSFCAKISKNCDLDTKYYRFYANEIKLMRSANDFLSIDNFLQNIFVANNHKSNLISKVLNKIKKNNLNSSEVRVILEELLSNYNGFVFNKRLIKRIYEICLNYNVVDVIIDNENVFKNTLLLSTRIQINDFNAKLLKYCNGFANTFNREKFINILNSKFIDEKTKSNVIMNLINRFLYDGNTDKLYYVLLNNIDLRYKGLLNYEKISKIFDIIADKLGDYWLFVEYTKAYKGYFFSYSNKYKGSNEYIIRLLMTSIDRFGSSLNITRELKTITRCIFKEKNLSSNEKNFLIILLLDRVKKINNDVLISYTLNLIIMNKNNFKIKCCLLNEMLNICQSKKFYASIINIKNEFGACFKKLDINKQIEIKNFLLENNFGKESPAIRYDKNHILSSYIKTFMDWMMDDDDKNFPANEIDKFDNDYDVMNVVEINSVKNAITKFFISKIDCLDAAIEFCSSNLIYKKQSITKELFNMHFDIRTINDKLLNLRNLIEHNLKCVKTRKIELEFMINVNCDKLENDNLKLCFLYDYIFNDKNYVLKLINNNFDKQIDNFDNEYQIDSEVAINNFMKFVDETLNKSEQLELYNSLNSYFITNFKLFNDEKINIPFAKILDYKTQENFGTLLNNKLKEKFIGNENMLNDLLLISSKFSSSHNKSEK